MPTLGDLLEEFRRRRLDPNQVFVKGAVYDDLIDAAEEDAEAEEEE